MTDPQRKANLFLVGAVKAGTTTLYEALGRHPEIFCSSIKETYYFASDVRAEMPGVMRQDLSKKYHQYLSDPATPCHDALVEDVEAYANLFEAVADETVLMEGTVANLYSHEAASKIHAYNPDARIMMVLRDPIERAFSHYLMDVRDSSVTDDFLTAFKADCQEANPKWGDSRLYAGLGSYASQVERYLDRFGADRVLVLRFSELKRDFASVLQQVCRFVDVDPEALSSASTPHANRAKVSRYPMLTKQLRHPVVQAVAGRIVPAALRRKIKSSMMTSKGLPKLTPQIKQELFPVFEDDICQLEKLLDFDLSDWRAA